jgi:hypothetical protein
MKKKTIITILALIIFSACKDDKEKFEPEYTATTEFRGFDASGKAMMFILGDVSGPKNTSSPVGETLHCDATDDLKKQMNVNDATARFKCGFNFYKRVGKDRYKNAYVLKKL